MSAVSEQWAGSRIRIVTVIEEVGLCQAWLVNRSFGQSPVHDLLTHTEILSFQPRPPPSLFFPHPSVADRGNSLLNRGQLDWHQDRSLHPSTFDLELTRTLLWLSVLARHRWWECFVFWWLQQNSNRLFNLMQEFWEKSGCLMCS